jgi:hypothetical protein
VLTERVVVVRRTGDEHGPAAVPDDQFFEQFGDLAVCVDRDCLNPVAPEVAYPQLFASPRVLEILVRGEVVGCGAFGDPEVFTAIPAKADA